ncbi:MULTISPECIES: LysR family transcriptional regulator [Phyllobacteriaceae]|jgi:DNA-binding transcriptional LysR family regulator|uniref:LysR family transcriptional regulator n=1 Tax=Mesorhizobium hungaricum TaxID=1566387 RepID=A0A1C2DYY2_9HYPH|nr:MULTISPECIES: LysR family transcriptional regulator [Mesorhizobium]MBN9234600.1 LysR family transcriptional regulator [Mesorhizobium sp.]MDQ0328920.1 DNA-binding transcriptional LysR family regulator [Mesorhizobium sp. YL-MeA3-2017]OCX19958.1 LysR family transcriptional regulator [Mesorhizobium hungaricum]
MQANPTLDQLQVFLAVAETGSFSRAARHLNRAQSVISYTIANLEGQLELKLFTREGTREPTLTAEGKAMLADARRMIGVLQDIRARADGLKRGLEAELAIAVDVTVPSPALVRTLAAFEVEFPSVSLKLNVGALGVIWDQLAQRLSDLSFGGQPQTLGDELVSVRVGDASMTPVAAPGHPLATYQGRVPLSEVREHIQLVVSDVSKITEGKEFSVFAYRTWRMTDMSTKRDLILSGLGWGGLPTWMILEDVSAGRLKILDLEPYPERPYPLHAFYRADTPPGPAGSWLIERFKEELPKVCSTLQHMSEREERLRAAQEPDGLRISPSMTAASTAR